MLVVSVPAQSAMEESSLPSSTPAPRAFVGLKGSELGAEATRLRPVLRAVAARVLGLPGQHSDVEDCVSEALRRVVEGRARVRDDEPVGPWAVGIVRHVALDLLRRQRRERGRKGAEDDEEREVVDGAPAPDDVVDQRQRLATLRVALAELPDGQRRALIAFHAEGASYQAIAAELGVAMGTVATWIARGRKALGERLVETSGRGDGAGASSTERRSS